MKKYLTSLVVLFTLALPLSAYAAIARDGTSNNYSASQTGTYSISITLTTGVNDVLTCHVIGTSVASTGMTDNGSAMTNFYSYAYGGNTQYGYYDFGAGSGSHTIVDSFTGGPTDIQLFCIAWSGANQSSFPNASVYNSVATGNLTQTLTVSANAWMFSTGRNTNAGVMTAGAGVTDESSGTRYFAAGDSNGALSAGSQSQTWTTGNGGANASHGIAFSIAPFVTVTTPTTFSQFLSWF